MKFEEFEKAIKRFPIRYIEEHVIILKGEDTLPYEWLLQNHGCKEFDWNEFCRGHYKLGTYLVLSKDKNSDDFPPNIPDYFMDHYVLSVTCDPEDGSRNWFDLMMNMIKEEWEKRTGEAMVPYEEWSDSVKQWLLDNYMGMPDVVNKFVTGVLNGEIK